ncbi:MAG: hypothetical protein F4038_07745 [Chloroflexi bacterium]|nr:hypothetical protein [Chloroflexota bacterium]MYG90903.1 hypothetical protein [Chloroflexota bacterium]MYJ92924.1 hypothetical protein [Chloroflexota bacterium]
MPTCGRVTHFNETSRNLYWRYTAKVRPPSLRDHLSMAVKRSLMPGVQVTPGYAWNEIVLATRSPDARSQIRSLLELLSRSVTIEDDADCSHALGVHTLFNPDVEDTSGAKTYIGEVASDAKYTGHVWSAGQLADLMADFVDSHPLYSQASRITCPPSSNDGFNTSGLAYRMAQRVSNLLGLPFVSMSGSQREARKNKRRINDCSDVIGTFEVTDHVSGDTVLVVDDLYGHGCTINEATRALRVSRCKRVLALSGSKDASGCQGLPPHIDKWPNWVPAESRKPAGDLPFK